MRVIAEGDASSRQLAAPLDVDVLRTIDEDVADRRVAEQRLDRSKSGDFVDDLLDDLLALGRGEWGFLGTDEVDHRVSDLRRHHALVRDPLQSREVETLHQLAVQLEL